MAREKGTGSLQQEKSGRWTVRVGISGKRFSRSARTRDRAKAEAFLNRMLAPFGLGDKTIPLAEVWREYEKSPNRKEQTESTMNSKRVVWMRFAAWIEDNHIEITQLKQLSADAVAEYLRVFRIGHTASTYNNHVCVLREICRVVSDKAGVVEDPWAGVQLLPDDSHTRREFTIDELKRIMDAATRLGTEWRMLFAVGMYTGLRLGDCCRLEWTSVSFKRGVIQVIPSKTKKHAHGRPVTIPIHPSLMAELEEGRVKRDEGKENASPYVMPEIASWYTSCHWKVDQGLKTILADAGIASSVKLDGRRTVTPDATFHSLRHTFVSFSANAGVPLPVVSSIVGHTSTAMTRHYYHENESALRAAVNAIPSLDALARREGGERGMGNGERSGVSCFCATDASSSQVPQPPNLSPAQRLKRLARYFSKGIITEAEYATQRAAIVASM